jgi:hypothetical protein
MGSKNPTGDIIQDTELNPGMPALAAIASRDQTI